MQSRISGQCFSTPLPAQRIFQWRKFYLWCRLLRNKQIFNIELMDNYKEMLLIFLPEGVLDYQSPSESLAADSDAQLKFKFQQTRCWFSFQLEPSVLPLPIFCS